MKMTQKLKSKLQIGKDFEDLSLLIKTIFNNWRSNSIAEFFEFKSNKSLYKIKVVH